MVTPSPVRGFLFLGKKMMPEFIGRLEKMGKPESFFIYDKKCKTTRPDMIFTLAKHRGAYIVEVKALQKGQGLEKTFDMLKRLGNITCHVQEEIHSTSPLMQLGRSYLGKRFYNMYLAMDRSGIRFMWTAVVNGLKGAQLIREMVPVVAARAATVKKLTVYDSIQIIFILYAYMILLAIVVGAWETRKRIKRLIKWCYWRMWIRMSMLYMRFKWNKRLGWLNRKLLFYPYFFERKS